MAQEGDHNERIKAIQQLALIDHLKGKLFFPVRNLFAYLTSCH